jgi:nucleoside-diphosphate-sugar epimerase
MMAINMKREYNKDVELAEVAAHVDFWDLLRGKTLVISGATGMIGTYLIDLLMHQNAAANLNCSVVALGRNAAKAQARLPYFGKPGFTFVEVDVSSPGFSLDVPAHYVLHLASSTHPLQYSANPIGTISANVAGTENLLKFAVAAQARFVLASSVEIYGENRGDTERFDEAYCGYIDCNTLRACYTESKRLAEAMCQAYAGQAGANVVIARLARAFGPTLLPDDSKALSQFLHNAACGQNIVLKSAGTQRYSYIYVADAACGLLAAAVKGKCGQAYNFAGSEDITLKQLAQLVAESGGVQVVQDAPTNAEAAGFSKATKALLNCEKAAADLNWRPTFTLKTTIPQTLKALRDWK